MPLEMYVDDLRLRVSWERGGTALTENWKQEIRILDDPLKGTLTITAPKECSEGKMLSGIVEVIDACANRRIFHLGQCFTGAPNGTLGIASAIVALEDALVPELKARLDRTVKEFFHENGMSYE